MVLLSNILRFREITNRQLANHLGVSEVTISKWCTGSTNISYKNLVAICEFLDVTPNDIYGYNDTSNLGVSKPSKDKTKHLTNFDKVVQKNREFVQEYVSKQCINSKYEIDDNLKCESCRFGTSGYCMEDIYAWLNEEV